MTDRELLELAAKAAGYSVEGDADTLVVFPAHFSGGFSIINEKGGSSLWNPFTDDGDALRLAVKLKFDLEWDFDEVNVNYSAAEFENENPYAATRRAIVRAAAEIGRAM